MNKWIKILLICLFGLSMTFSQIVSIDTVLGKSNLLIYLDKNCVKIDEQKNCVQCSSGFYL